MIVSGIIEILNYFNGISHSSVDYYDVTKVNLHKL